MDKIWILSVFVLCFAILSKMEKQNMAQKSGKTKQKSGKTKQTEM